MASMSAMASSVALCILALLFTFSADQSRTPPAYASGARQTCGFGREGGLADRQECILLPLASYEEKNSVKESE
jgi:hypothetical protein